MVVVVPYPILEASRRPGRLHAPDQAFGHQQAEGVVHRLKRDGADLDPHRLGHGVGRDVRLTRNHSENSQSLRRDLNAALPKEIGRIGCHELSRVDQLFDSLKIRHRASAHRGRTLTVITISECDIFARRMALPAPVLQILITLADGERHGYAIMQDIADRTDGGLRLGPGTLYGSIKRMLNDGLIVESERRPAAADDDPRRRYYRITARGRKAATDELDRLAKLVRQGRALGLAAKTS
jgi:DNA-binding PadR family transcriptional regulator